MLSSSKEIDPESSCAFDKGILTHCSVEIDSKIQILRLGVGTGDDAVSGAGKYIKLGHYIHTPPLSAPLSASEEVRCSVHVTIATRQ